MKERCGNCRFWWREELSIMGLCRYEPPRVIVELQSYEGRDPEGNELPTKYQTHTRVCFPDPSADFWCGKYERADRCP